MINFLAAFYQNIWPFNDAFCSLIFEWWKFLIKAPIWSWKSFLFFDCPRYALYKDNSRNMLNLQCKSGEISLIFEVDWLYYLVKRLLKSTKLWNDSCSSHLYSINYSWNDLLWDIRILCKGSWVLKWWVNVIDVFEYHNGKLWTLDEICFKNETDLQTSLENLLPPKEVFLSTVFLLQDADNIFEMRPSDRLLVLKNVFNLLWIDDAKEKVQEKKKEIWYKLKALQDHSLEDNKFRTNLKWLWNCLKNLENDAELKDILIYNNQFFEDIEWFFDQISLNDFSLSWLDSSLFIQAENVINSRVDSLVKINAQFNEYQQQLLDINKKKLKIGDEISNINLEISNLDKKINWIDVKKWLEIKERKLQLYEKWVYLSKTANYSVFSEFVDFWNTAAGDDFKKFQQPDDLKSAYEILQSAKDWWIRLKSTIEMEKTQLENIELQKKNREENHIREIEKLKDLKSRKNGDIRLLKTRILELDRNWENASEFDCPDLCKKCPYISAINKQQYDQYIVQKEELNSNLNSLIVDLDKLDLENKIRDLENLKYPESDDFKNDLEKKIKQQSDFSWWLRNYLIEIWFSDWEKSYHEWESIQNDIQNIDKELFIWEEENKNLDKYKQDKIALWVSIQHLEKSLVDLDAQINDINIKVSWLDVHKEKLNSFDLKKQQDLIKQCFQYLTLLEQLIEDSVNNKNLTNKLQEDEKKLSRLYSILWKDIVLFALDGYLPVLSDVINGYLSQCVDYSIKMQIVENWEKLELDVKILDWKWEREVKSLSWWQRTVLKLVWMLSISSYLNTPLLFLDETINNLDADTVWKVSEMIDNFVKQRTMKFYTVTHNKEIQDMQIWDDVIEVNQVEKSE